MKKISNALITILCAGLSSVTLAATTVTIEKFNENGKTTNIGTVTLEDTSYGVLITPDLTSLPAGLHGFHVHEKPSCDNAGMAAGGHLDPAKTNKHLGPYNDSGHLGDLPVLIVDENGNATLPLLAPKAKVSEISKHAIMIHAGGDNYSDKPKKLGGGGARIACGVIK